MSRRAPARWGLFPWLGGWAHLGCGALWSFLKSRGELSTSPSVGRSKRALAASLVAGEKALRRAEPSRKHGEGLTWPVPRGGLAREAAVRVDRASQTEPKKAH